VKNGSGVAVVIPAYKPELNAFERLSLNTCARVLHRYPRVLVAPAGLSFDTYREKHPDIDVETFDPRFFASTAAYSELLLSPDFYARFERYEYILIYQLDCLVFRDALTEWCRGGYDYLGAPWFGEIIEGLLNFYKPWWRRGPLPNAGGNGGLSLRHVGASLRVLSLRGSAARRWGRLYEDVFWGVYVPSKFPWFRIADQKTCARFAIQTEPDACLELTGGEVPFGCHAWFKRDLAFWLELVAAHDLVPGDELFELVLEPLTSQVRVVRDAIDRQLPDLGAWATALRNGQRRSDPPATTDVNRALQLLQFAASTQLTAPWP